MLIVKNKLDIDIMCKGIRLQAGDNIIEDNVWEALKVYLREDSFEVRIKEEPKKKKTKK